MCVCVYRCVYIYVCIVVLVDSQISLLLPARDKLALKQNVQIHARNESLEGRYRQIFKTTNVQEHLQSTGVLISR